MPVGVGVGASGHTIKKAAEDILIVVLIAAVLAITFGAVFWTWIIFRYDWKHRDERHDHRMLMWVTGIAAVFFLAFAAALFISHGHPWYMTMGRPGHMSGHYVYPGGYNRSIVEGTMYWDPGTWHPSTLHRVFTGYHKNTPADVAGGLMVFWATGLIASTILHWWYVMHDVNGKVVTVPAKPVLAEEYRAALSTTDQGRKMLPPGSLGWY